VSRLKTVALGTGSLILIGLLVLVVLRVRAAREAAIECNSTCPLARVHLALSNYHAVHGCFPPAYVADKDGKPMHSWRVLILPVIKEQALYAAYRLDEPWNGPNNSKLMDKMPEFFHVCSEPASTSCTNVVVLTGPGTAFPGAMSTQQKDFTDGLNNTILVAEIAHSNINWLEPRDLHVRRMSFRVNDPSRPSISTSRRTGPYVVSADGSVFCRLSPSLSEETLRSLTTIAGGEEMFVAEVAGLGLTSPLEGAATDGKIRQLDLDGLCSLWLSRSMITDATLRQLAAAPRLSALYLRSTRITDDGLRHFQQGPPLRELDLSYTAIGDDGLRHLANLTKEPKLRINVEGSRVTTSGVAQFVKSLERGRNAETWVRFNEGVVSERCLFFAGSAVTDAEIECFRGISGIRQVDVRKTQITDASLEFLSTLPDLAHLDVADTPITDAGLQHLKGLAKLETLHLEGTQVTDYGLEILGTLPRLQSVDLSRTRATGECLTKLQQAMPDCQICK